MAVLNVSSLAEFEQLKSQNNYLVVDFYADWCAPCKAIKPLCETLANTHARPGRLAFVKVNVDAAADVARRYAVAAIPTFMFFDGGEPWRGGRGTIRAADPRSLQSTVQELSGLAKKKEEAAEAAASSAAAAATAEKATADNDAADVNAKPDDGSTVSGGYTLGGGSSNARSDWKMSLRG